MTDTASSTVASLALLVARRQGERDIAQQAVDRYALERAEIVSRTERAQHARKLLEVFVTGTELQLRNYIEPIVTDALEFVFEQHLKFHILFAQRRNQVEIDFILIRTEETEAAYQLYVANPSKHEKQLELLVRSTRNLDFMYGGAVNQVLSVILKFVHAEALGLQGPLTLDEPSSAVSEEYNSRLGLLLASLSKKFSRQVILITHSRTLAACADVQYLVEKKGNVSSALLIVGE